MLHTEALIFDLDGTLWDTSEACAQGWARAFQLLKLERPAVSASTLRSLMGQTGEEIRQTLFGDLPMEVGQGILEACFTQEIHSILGQGGQLYAGVSDTLQQLARRFKLYLVSNCDEAYLAHFCDLHPVSTCFLDLECHGRTGWPKHENIRLLMERNALASAIYIGDTLGDQLAAAKAGISFVHAAYGFGQVQNQPPQIQSFAELETLVCASA